MISNNIIIWIQLFFIIISSFFIRSIFIIKYGWFGSDTFFHLHNAKRWKKQGKKIWTEKIDRFFIEGNYNYPPLLHYFISLFPQKHYKKIQYISPLSDIVSSIVILLFTFYLWENLLISGLLVFIFLFSPINLIEATNLSPRPLAKMFVILMVTTLYYFYLTDIYLLLIISVLFESLVILTRKRSWETSFAILIGLALILQSIYPILIFLLGVFIVIFITRGNYIVTFKDHFILMKWLSKTGPLFFKSKFTNPVRVLLHFPFIVFLPLIVYNLSFHHNFDILFFSAVFAGVFLLTILWPFGLGHLSIVDAIFPFLILLGFYFNGIENWILFLILSIVSIGTISITMIACFKFNRIFKKWLPMIESFSISEKELLAYDFINKNLDNSNFLYPIPNRKIYTLLFFTEISIFTGGYSKEGVRFCWKHFKPDMSLHDFADVINEFDIKYIFVDNKYLNLKKLEKIDEKNIIYSLYSFDRYFIIILSDRKSFSKILKEMPNQRITYGEIPLA